MPIFSGFEVEEEIIVFQINSRVLARAPHFFGLLQATQHSSQLVNYVAQ
jgi:hypothetical protein